MGITVGGTDDHWVMNPSTGAAMKRAAKLRWYAAPTGGTPLTLTYLGQPVTQIPVPAGGFYPEHVWPDGVSVAYGVALENAVATDLNFESAARIKHVPSSGGGGADPDLIVPTQAEAEAGTATTGRKFSAQRVFQAIAAALPSTTFGRSILNSATAQSVRSLLGLSAKWDFYGRPDGLSISASGSYLIQSATTLASATLWCDSAPVGSNLVVELQRSTNSGSTWSTLVTLTVPAGSTTEVGATVTTALASGDRIRTNITSVGSTTAAKGGGFVVNAA